MNKVKKPKIIVRKLSTSESNQRLQNAYSIIFDMSWRKIRAHKKANKDPPRK